MTPMVPASFGEIHARFAAARHPAPSWDIVVTMFRWVDVEMRLDLPTGLPCAQSLFLVRMRGALGRALRETDILLPDQEEKDEQPGAARLMFHTMGEMAKGLEYPKPFVLQFDPADAVLRVRLFGPAMVFAAEIAAALVRIAGQREDNPFGRPVTIAERRILAGCLNDLRDGRLEPEMAFATPLVMRHGQTLQNAPNAVLRGLLRRVSGILAWQGLAPPGGFEDIQMQLANRFTSARWINKPEKAEIWPHPSARQQRVFYEEGTLGTLVLGAPALDLLPLLQLGEVVHVGAKAAIGCGRFRLEYSPAGMGSAR